MKNSETLHQTERQMDEVKWIQSDLRDALGSLERLRNNPTLRKMTPTGPLRCESMMGMIADLLRTCQDQLQDLQGSTSDLEDLQADIFRHVGLIRKSK